MKQPILSAKHRIPSPTSAYLPRKRLDRRWEEWRDRRLVLVTAGAGFGKTSFLAANAEQSRRPCIWYSLDEFDAEPATFLSQLAEAIGQATKQPFDGKKSTDPEFANRLLAHLVRLLPKLEDGVVFVFDDLQLVSESTVILRFLERLVQFLPERSTVILASREPIGVRAARFRSQGLATGLKPKDLLFTEHEVEQLLQRRFPGIDVDRKLVRSVLEKTEGWAAGIEILFQVVSGASSWGIRQALEQVSFSDSGWFGYFAEEVLSRLNPRMQDFLRRSSLIPHLEPGLCDRILGIEDSRGILEELSHRNLFTFAVGEDGEGYRYHHLFRKFLQDQLLRALAPEEVRRLRLRAAELLAEAGAWAEAAAAYAEAGDPIETLNVIRRIGEDLLRTGKYRVLRNALNHVPSELLDRDGTALTILGQLQEISGDWDDACRSYEKAYAQTPAGSRRAELLSLLARNHIRRGEYRVGEKVCGQALEQLGRRRPVLRGEILCLLGVTAAELGRLDEAETRFEDACRILRKAGQDSQLGRVLAIQAANVQFRRGEFQRAKDLGRQSLVIFQKLGDHQNVCASLMGIGQHSVAAGEEREAQDLLDSALRLAESLDYRMAEGYCHHNLGRCALLSGNGKRAREHFETALRIGDQLKEVSLLTWPRVGMVEVALLEGNRRSAQELIKQILAIARPRKDRFVEGQCYTLLGLAEQTSKGDSADSWWRKAERIFRRIDGRYELHRVLLLRASSGAYGAKKEREVLLEFMTGVATLGHEFLLLRLEPERGVELLSRALRQEIESDYVDALLIRFGERAVAKIAPLIEESVEQTRRRAVEILARIGGEEARRALTRAARSKDKVGGEARAAARDLEIVPTIPLEITTFREFTVKVGERELSREAWKSARALRLFQLLLVHRFRWVPKEVVLESLWPDTDPAKAENSLRQSIHLLRKMLEPDLEGSRESHYVRYRNETYRLDPGKASSYDVDLFEKLFEEGRRAQQDGKKRKAEQALRAAIETYRGPFLEESPYEEFVASERENLRDSFLRALNQLIELRAAARNWEDVILLCRRGLTEDRYAETLYEHLLLAHLRLGNRGEALAAYHAYEKMMTQDLDLLPSGRMRTLADQAIGLGKAKGKGNQ